MKLPLDLLTQNYVKPRLFLCETDKTKMCQLETISMSGSFKFNAYSELNFTVGRTYINMNTGETHVNPFYDKIEALRLVLLEGFGYFEIQDPEIVSDGIKEVKNVTAYSLEYRLSQKYLENFKINTGEVDSVEVIKAGNSRVIPVSLVYHDKDLSLTDLALEKIYDWSWGDIDESLRTMSRQFDISRASVYDFIVQDLCEKFNCYATFDTIENKINLHAEALITKYIGDGSTTSFEIPYSAVDTVTIDSYKTTGYTIQVETDKFTKDEIYYVVFDDAPAERARIEITDGSQTKWRTDVYVSFDNLAQEVNVNYSAEDIKTVLTVKGADDLDIRDVNMGLPYIVDLSYYYTIDWMGQDLYNAYTAYLSKCNNAQKKYKENAQEMLRVQELAAYEQSRSSLQFSVANGVTNTTVGTYYVRDGIEPNYYYTEVKLPDEWKANTVYYMESGSDLDEKKFRNLYNALMFYFKSQSNKDTSELENLKESFSFVDVYSIDKFISNLSGANTIEQKEQIVYDFYDELLNQLGLSLLENYKTTYANNDQKIAKEEGFDDPSNDNYWLYYTPTLVVNILESEIQERKNTIQEYKDEYSVLYKENEKLAKDSSIYKNFSHEQLIRLSPFLREDEYTDDNFIQIDSDTIMTTKQELLECGKIELARLCEPKLAFSMDMANIYALKEFEPIIHQFQLGRLINVVIRDDYIKRARLLAVDINFDDFSDFSCEFGELTSLRTQSSIHADLLSNALTAANSVASNQSYWNKGTDLATSTDLKIQNGLLNAIDGIYSANKEVLIDNHGILLRELENNGEYSPYQIWLTNNNILVSTDSFQTSQTGIGVFEVDGREMYGVLAKAVLAGYIESSTIVGGTINIGDGKFVVDEFGNVTMKAASIEGYVTSNDLSSKIEVTEKAIESKVSKGSIISTINQSAESVTIDANKISLAGKEIDLTGDDITIESTNFSVTKDGAITATSGEIAGWTIYDSLLRKETVIDDVTYQMYMQATDGVSTSNAFAVRKKNPDVESWDVQFSVNYAGKMTAKNANITGTITAKDGSIAGYNIGPGGCYSNAIYKRVTGDGTGVDYEVGLKATSGDTDLAFYVKQSEDDWASNSNVFYVRNNGQLYAKNADVSGKITASNGKIGGWDIGTNDISGENGEYKALISKSAIGTSGNVVFGVYDGSSWTCYMDGAGKLVASNADISGKITATSGSIGGCSISNGVLNISAANITSGTIASARIPSLSADKITSGTLDPLVLDASVVTTGNFSSKTLSTGKLTIKSGCTIGSATYNAEIDIRDKYVYLAADGPTSYGTTIHEIVRQAVVNGSNKDIKSDIHDFDDRYDVFFDNLKPQLYKYNFELDEGYSMGYIWQDADEALGKSNLTKNDVGAVYESGAVTGGLGLRKTDFIALNTWQIQKLKNRIVELENKLEAIERNDTK